jgi:integrase
MAKAVQLADDGEGGAIAALLALVMGMRASEIVSRVVRDLDDDGKLLWIPDSETEAGRRTLQVPAFLQPFLKQLADGKSSDAKLFGHHWRDWVRKWVKRQTRNPLGITRVCDRDCGVSRGFDSSGSLRFIPSVTIQIRVV